MFKNGAPWLMLATLGASIVAGYVAVTTAPPLPIPPCVVEDGGPIPCVWSPTEQGTFHPGDPTDKVTITQAP